MACLSQVLRMSSSLAAVYTALAACSEQEPGEKALKSALEAAVRQMQSLIDEMGKDEPEKPTGPLLSKGPSIPCGETPPRAPFASGEVPLKLEAAPVQYTPTPMPVQPVAPPQRELMGTGTGTSTGTGTGNSTGTGTEMMKGVIPAPRTKRAGKRKVYIMDDDDEDDLPKKRKPRPAKSRAGNGMAGATPKRRGRPPKPRPLLVTGQGLCHGALTTATVVAKKPGKQAKRAKDAELDAAARRPRGRPVGSKNRPKGANVMPPNDWESFQSAHESQLKPSGMIGAASPMPPSMGDGFQPAGTELPSMHHTQLPQTLLGDREGDPVEPRQLLGEGGVGGWNELLDVGEPALLDDQAGLLPPLVWV
ncbi:unnamed protein product [Chrysoparadoxa australica]